MHAGAAAYVTCGVWYFMIYSLLHLQAKNPNYMLLFPKAKDTVTK